MDILPFQIFSQMCPQSIWCTRGCAYLAVFTNKHQHLKLVEQPGNAKQDMRSRMAEASIKGRDSNYIPQYLWDAITVPVLDTCFWHTGHYILPMFPVRRCVTAKETELSVSVLNWRIFGLWNYNFQNIVTFCGISAKLPAWSHRIVTAFLQCVSI